jgi:hypothetical protein
VSTSRIFCDVGYPVTSAWRSSPWLTFHLHMCREIHHGLSVPDAGTKLWLRYVMLVSPDGKAIITYWSLVSIVTCWEAAMFSARPRLYTSVDIPYGIKANKRRVVKQVCYKRLFWGKRTPSKRAWNKGWVIIIRGNRRIWRQNCPTATSPSRNIMRREDERKVRQNYLHAQAPVHEDFLWHWRDSSTCF